MSSVHAVTEDIKFEARIASFYEMNDGARKELLENLSRVFSEHGKKHNYIVWRVKIVQEKNHG